LFWETPFLFSAISTIGLILYGARACSNSCPTHTKSHTKQFRESQFHLWPPHQHVGAHHPMARLPDPHTSPSTTPWPHYPPFVAVKFVVCSKRGNHTSWQITWAYRVGMTVVTTTNIILDNNTCRHVPLNDLAVCGKYEYDNWPYRMWMY
jgi:hypothetical protein